MMETTQSLDITEPASGTEGESATEHPSTASTETASALKFKLFEHNAKEMQTESTKAQSAVDVTISEQGPDEVTYDNISIDSTKKRREIPDTPINNVSEAPTFETMKILHKSSIHLGFYCTMAVEFERTQSVSSNSAARVK